MVKGTSATKQVFWNIQETYPADKILRVSNKFLKNTHAIKPV